MPEVYNHYLAVALFGTLHQNLLYELTQCGSKCHCSIQQSKLTSFGSEFSGNILFSGNWDAIAKLEIKLPKLAKKFDLKFVFSRTTQSEVKSHIPYRVQVLTSDRVGIIHDLVAFFWNKKIPIHYMHCDTFTPAPGGAALNRISLGIMLTIKQNISILRDSFMTHCDEKNLDAYFECDYQPG